MRVMNLTRLVLFLSIMSVPSLCLAQRQWIEYRITKSIYPDGTIHKSSDTKAYPFAFEGNYVYYDTGFYDTGVLPPIRFKFHHKEGSNAIYYQNNYQALEGYREDCFYDSALVVSPDRKTLNWIHNADRPENRIITVYKQGVDRTINEFYE